MSTYLTLPELEAGLEQVRSSPQDQGSLRLIVCRPQVGERQVLSEGVLNQVSGLVGDNWSSRPSTRTPDGSPHPEMQLNIINTRLIALLSPDPSLWPLAGDQLYIDLDLSEENLPSGSRLAIGSAVIEITAQPHTGCAKFAQRFGPDARQFVNTPPGRQLRLRGVNARVIQAGLIHTGDVVRKLNGSIRP